MRVLITEKLSEHRYKTPEGYLICVDAILARTGPQIYKHNQVYDNSIDEITDVEVDRKPEQVFSPEAIASFENKPLTIQHPNEPVTVANHKALCHGFVRDIRRAVKRNGQILTGSKRPMQLQDGDQEVLVGNVIVTTSEAIEAINNGLEYLSCGYDCDITQTDTPEQINIRGNHVALCDNPRAGITMLQDNMDSPMKHIVRVLTDALDATHNFVIDEQFVYVTPEYPIDSMNWLKYFAKELRLNVKIQIKSKYYDDKVYIIGRKSDVEKLVAEYNELYRNRKLVPTTSTEVNSKRVYNKGYSLPDNYTSDAINYVVMCEQLYNGVPVKSRAPWIVFRTEDKLEAEQFVKENNAKMKSLVGFSQRYYIK